jgi:hypothetical protein
MNSQNAALKVDSIFAQIQRARDAQWQSNRV